MKKIISESLNDEIIEGVIIVTLNYDFEIKRAESVSNYYYDMPYHKVEGMIDGKIIYSDITTNDGVLKLIEVVENKLRAELKSMLRSNKEPSIQQKLKDLGFN